MRIAVTGASGLIGRALLQQWTETRHRVVTIGRRPASSLAATPDAGLDAGPDAAPHMGLRTARPVLAGAHFRWDPAAGMLEPGALDGVDAVVHLAGESLAAGRWSNAFKERVHASRVQSTELIARSMAALPVPPRVLVCASAIGYYGDRGDEILTEDSTPGTGFLPATCRDWEGAAGAARTAGIRVVHVRIGIVLASTGGALAKMLPVFRLGLGGPFGSGRQWMSWISLADLVQIFDRALHDDTLAGPVNAVAPTPVTNGVFSRALGAALHRRALLRVPSAALRLLLGAEKASALLLSSTRVMPARLQAAGHPFLHGEIAAALSEVL